MPAWSISATGWPPSSRWRATTTRASSSPIRARRPASAASCATCSPWARGRSPTSTRCASAIPTHPRTRRIVDGVVRGIGGYGNCVGVPTVGGEINFHPAYNGNPLVNAMTVGIAPRDRIFLSAAAGVGNPVVYVGSKTGRDGIHGATMAECRVRRGQREEKRPTVQVGDPFTEKLLIEACLELMATDAIVAIQDMGAAGLTSSSVEMAGKGGVGIDARSRRGAAARDRHDRLRDDAVGEPGAHADGAAPRPRGRGARDLREVGTRFRRDRPADRHRAHRRAPPGPDRGGHPARPARRSGAALPSPDRADAAAGAAGRGRRSGRAGGGAAAPDRLPDLCFARLDLGPVRRDGGRPDGAAPRRRRCRRGAPRRSHARAGADHRLHAALLRGRSAMPAARRRWPRRGATSPPSARRRSPSPTT